MGIYPVKMIYKLFEIIQFSLEDPAKGVILLFIPNSLQYTRNHEFKDNFRSNTYIYYM